MPSTVFHVVPLSKDWQVVHDGQAIFTTVTRSDAVEEARRHARAARFGRVIVHERDTGRT